MSPDAPDRRPMMNAGVTPPRSDLGMSKRPRACSVITRPDCTSARLIQKPRECSGQALLASFGGALDLSPTKIWCRGIEHRSVTKANLQRGTRYEVLRCTKETEDTVG